MKQLLFAAGLAVAMVLSLGGTAHAQTKAVVDPAGDNRTPGYDLRGITYANTGKAVIARVKVRDLKRQAVVHVEITAREAVTGLGVEILKRDGKTRARMQETDSASPVRCPGLEATWRPLKGIVWVRVPASCLKLDMVVVRAKTWLRQKGGPVSDRSPARLVTSG